MCRNIKPLFNIDPPTSEEEVRDAALQFVRKISGYNKPSRANEAPFQEAVDAITTASVKLLADLETKAPARSREQAPRLRKQEGEPNL